MVTLRWNNEIHHLLTFARIGSNNDVRDNASAGGVSIGVDDNGNFNDFAINKDLYVFKEHPTTGFKFSEMPPIPNYHKFIDFVKELHEDILHHDFISWDIIVGKEAQPILLEANFFGATWLYQLASQQPMFGDLTEEILTYLSKELKNKKRRNSRSVNTKLRRRYNKSKKRNEKLVKDIRNYKTTIKSLKGDLEKYKKISVDKASKSKKYSMDYKKEYEKILNSTSWKITKPLRAVKSKLK